MTEQEWLDIFGDNLLEMMREFGINQRDLADEAGLSESTVSRYIKKQCVPNLRAIINIAHVLGCDVNELIDFGDRII